MPPQSQLEKFLKKRRTRRFAGACFDACCVSPWRFVLWIWLGLLVFLVHYAFKDFVLQEFSSIRAITSIDDDTEAGYLTFPEFFKWGVSTSAYQIEGAASKDGREQSTWDMFSHMKGRTYNGSTGDYATDHYHRYADDVEFISRMGVTSYRFSISWSRVLPKGDTSVVNEKGVAFYNHLINLLVKKGIEPIVTLYHFDMPMALYGSKSGWMTESIADDFAEYARFCFHKFGDRVKMWITINEPFIEAYRGHGTGEFAPGAKEITPRNMYIVAHNMLRAHAKAVAVFRSGFQQQHGGKISIALNSDWFEPKPTIFATAEETANKAVSERAMIYGLGWFAEPIWFGDYPLIMRQELGARLPKFSPMDKLLINGSADFFALNHYTTHYVEPAPDTPGQGQNMYYADDVRVLLSEDPTWPQTSMGWSIVPWGLKKLMQWVEKTYEPNGGIIILENGCATAETDLANSVADFARVKFLYAYLFQVWEAMQQGVRCKGYFVWSLLDNFEWAAGYSQRFGLVHVNMTTFKRTPKLSSQWYAAVAMHNRISAELPSDAYMDRLLQTVKP